MVSLFLQGTNGDEIALDGNDDFVLQTGLRGLGLPTTDVRIVQSAADGGTWRGTRRGIRELDVPIAIIGTSPIDVENKLRRLANALSDRYLEPVLRADYDTGESWSIPVHYASGAETSFGDDAGQYFCIWPMTWQAPDPYWTSNEAIGFSVRSEAGLTFLPELQELHVASSQALGTINIENPGDVAAFPTWTIQGPCTAVEITLDGVGFTYDETLIAGDTIVISSRAATVVDETGANKYSFLGSAPKLFTIPPGTSSVSITATGADSNTVISGYFNPRREVIF
jgi:hypothetical protein